MNFSGQLGQDEIPIEPIKYTFPEDKLKLGALPFKWHIPIILETIFETEGILKLMTAVMLERSIIVVSEDQAKISSVILGLIEMIQPFQWQFIQIPVLPEALLDTLDVPVPIIAGITEASFGRLIEDYNLSETFIDSMTWVFLDPVGSEGPRGPHLMPTWRPTMRDIKWSVYEGNITEEEQDWFKKYDQLRKLEEIHREFKSSGVSHSIDSYKSLASKAQEDEGTCLELTDKQLRIVDQFVVHFQRMFYLQVLRVINNAPLSVAQSAI